MKYCPLKQPGLKRECDYEKCAWYYIDACSIREIAFNLKQIADNPLTQQDITKALVDAKE